MLGRYTSLALGTHLKSLTWLAELLRRKRMSMAGNAVEYRSLPTAIGEMRHKNKDVRRAPTRTDVVVVRIKSGGGKILSISSWNLQRHQGFWENHGRFRDSRLKLNWVKVHDWPNLISSIQGWVVTS